jgi:hypothetical protein
VKHAPTFILRKFRRAQKNENPKKPGIPPVIAIFPVTYFWIYNELTNFLHLHGLQLDKMD